MTRFGPQTDGSCCNGTGFADRAAVPCPNPHCPVPSPWDVRPPKPATDDALYWQAVRAGLSPVEARGFACLDQDPEETQ